MKAFRGCSAVVIRCFKKVESFADWLTGAAGPVFVFFCWSLIGLGGVAFFDTIARDLSWFSTIVLSPVLVLVPFNMYGQYFLASTVPPGYPSPRALQKSPDRPMSTDQEIKWLTHDPRSPCYPEYWGWRKSSSSESRILTGNAGSGAASGSLARKRVRRCRKCDGPKPERAHHCSVCKRCVLLMDHHCPWINGCVGVNNQRHFVLFMAWLSLACWCVFVLGWDRAWLSLDYVTPWNGYTPRIAFTLLYVLSIAIGIAVPVLGGWHVYLASRGESSIESHDNHYLEGKAKAEGLIYLNPYDLGRKRNLQLFFNVGPGGYPKATLFFPLLVPPYTNGWTFPRRPLPADHSHDSHYKPGLKLHEPELADGLISSENGRAPENGKYVMGDQEGLTDDEEGLTDDEEGGGGWMDYDY